LLSKLNKLLKELIEYTDFKTNKSSYRMAIQVITVCAEEYRYNFELLKELLRFEKNETLLLCC